MKLSGLEIPPSHQKIAAHLNQASIPTRYPQDMAKITKQYTKAIAEKYLEETESLLKWLKQIK